MLRFPKLHEKLVDVVTALLRRRLPVTNSMVENLVCIELSYINTKHPDFTEAGLVNKAFNESMDLDNRKVTVKEYHNNNNLRAVEERPSSRGSIEGEQIIRNKPKSSSLLSEQVLQHPSNAVALINPSNFGLPNSIPPSPSRKGINLLDEPQVNTGRKLSTREAKHCEIIERLIKCYFLIVRKNIQDSVPKAIMHFLVNNVKDNLQSELVTHLYKQDEISRVLEESEHMTARRKEASDMVTALQKASQIISEIRETHMW